MLDLICVGIALVDSIIRGFDPKPVSASGYRAVSGSLSVGGEAVNEAMCAARLGLKTGIFCSLGKDAAGELIIGELERAGVDTGRIERGGNTPVSTIFVSENGKRKSIVNEAHRYPFRPDGHPELFTDARALMLGSLFRAPFDDPAVIHSVLTDAKKAGQLVFADTKIPNFRKIGLPDLRDSLSMIDCLTPNEDEAKFFTGKDTPEEMADVFLECGVQSVIVKLGERGCFLKNGGGSIRLPGIPVKAVDSTGAGDSFLAGFSSEILRNSGVSDALSFANACGALCATAVGAGTALRNREQVLAWMRENVPQT